MDEEGEQLFRQQWQKRQQKLRGIIAVIGLPSTAKTEVAGWIGDWAKCPVLCIQHFLDEERSIQGADAAEYDHQLLVQRAFTNLCKVAHFHLSRGSATDSTVVIKSRLNSLSEIHRLLELATGTYPSRTSFPGKTWLFPLLIIDCRRSNEFQWRQCFDAAADQGRSRWPASWSEMEELISSDHVYQAKWDLHLQQVLVLRETDPDKDSPYVLRRLVLDSIRDVLDVESTLRGDVSAAIKYLLTAPEEEFEDISDQSRYTVEFSQLRPYLLEQRWEETGWKGKSKYLCPQGDCVFEFDEYYTRGGDCWACNSDLRYGSTAYRCRLCNLLLHKSCAERIDFEALGFNLMDLNRGYSEHYLRVKRACGSCVHARKGFDGECGSCVFQTQLKCGPLPTVVKHDFHPAHLLSLMLSYRSYVCKACGTKRRDFAYCCRQCALYYHLECALLPLELEKHKHGGHREHVMKLRCSRHAAEQEESYWCDVCYGDMDPQLWYYRCQMCPYYVAHVHCARGYKYLRDLWDVKLVEQIQLQLDQLRTEVINE